MKSNNLINLESLIDLSAKLIELGKKERIINTALLSLMGKLKYTKALIIIPDDNNFIVKKLRDENHFKIHKFSLPQILKIDKNISKELFEENIDICIPIISDNNLLAGLCFGKRLVNDSLNEEEIKYAGLVSSITANAVKNSNNLIEIKNQKNQAEQKTQLLRTIFEISKDFNKILTRKQIIKLISFHLMGQLTITKFAMYEFRQNKVISDINKFSFEPSDDCLLFLKSLNKIVDFKEDVECKKFSTQYKDFKYSIPMQLQGETKGVFIIGSKLNGEELTDDNISFLESLASISISSLENERLFREEITKRQLENELMYAREIQQNLLPKAQTEIPNYDIYGISYPSRDIGGDYYDIIRISENEYLLAVADVSGKGMPAALIMANIQSALKIIAEDFKSLTDTVDKLNRIIYNNTSADKFVTLFIGILDISNDNFKFINAGHNPAMFLNEKNTLWFRSSGLLLGFDEKCDDYTEEVIAFNVNDLLFIYTDGVNEAEDINRNDFGYERMESSIKQNMRSTSRGIINSLLYDINEFTGSTVQYDDITMISIVRKS